MHALITGITGQDGSYLAELLLHKGYYVFGLVPHRNQSSMPNIAHLLGHKRLTLIDGDMLDHASLCAAISQTEPDEIYNLAGQSFVAKSWDMPEITHAINHGGLVAILEACRRFSPTTRIYQASTSEMFGNALTKQQNEKTPFHPASPYAISKVAAHYSVVNYRESHNLFVCAGILFNHESPRRGEHFVTQKICKAMAMIAAGRQDTVRLGALESRRDWGYAPDYVDAMWRMLQTDCPDDYVIATGTHYSVLECVEAARIALGLPGDAMDYIEQDSSLHRPVDVLHLCGDASKAREKLDWEPTTTFQRMIGIMVRRWVDELEQSPLPATPV